MPKTYSTTQAARLLGVSTRTIKRYVRQGKLPDRRLPGARKLRFMYDDLFPVPATTAQNNSVTESEVTQ